MTLSPIFAAARRHPQLAAGLIVVFVVLAFGPVGTLFVDTDLPASARRNPICRRRWSIFSVLTRRGGICSR